MKIILLHDVSKIGKRFDVKKVSDGYASNFLIPRNLAEFATPKKLRSLEEQKKRKEDETKIQHELLQKDLKKLDKKTVTLTARTNEQGHLFKGIHEEDILSVIEKELGCSFPRDTIKLSEAIKTVGEFPLEAVIGEGKARFTLTITAA